MADLLENTTIGGKLPNERLTTLENKFEGDLGYVRYLGSTAGSGNAYTISVTPAVPVYADGVGYSFKANRTSTGLATLNISSRGAKPIYNSKGEQAGAGDIVNGSIYTVRYNGTNFILQGEGGGSNEINGEIEAYGILEDDVEKGDMVYAVEQTERWYMTDNAPSLTTTTISNYPVDVTYNNAGTHLVIVKNTTPNIEIYAVEEDGGFRQLDTPTDIQNTACTGVVFTPDDEHLIITHKTTPFVSFYKRNGEQYVRMTNPSVLPTGSAYKPAVSPDGNFLAIPHQVSPYVTIYARNGDAYSKSPNLSPIPTSACYAATFSPDDEFLVIGGGDEESYLQAFARSGDSFLSTHIPQPPAGVYCNILEFSPDSAHLAVSTIVTSSGQQGLYIFKRVEDYTFQRLTSENVPAFTTYPTAMQYTPTENYLLLSGSGSNRPMIMVFKREGDNYTNTSLPYPPSSVVPRGGATGIALNPNSNSIEGIVIGANSPDYIASFGRGYKLKKSPLPLSEKLPEGAIWAGYAKESGSIGQDVKVSKITTMPENTLLLNPRRLDTVYSNTVNSALYDVLIAQDKKYVAQRDMSFELSVGITDLTTGMTTYSTRFFDGEILGIYFQGEKLIVLAVITTSVEVYQINYLSEDLEDLAAPFWSKVPPFQLSTSSHYILSTLGDERMEVRATSDIVEVYPQNHEPLITALPMSVHKGVEIGLRTFLLFGLDSTTGLPAMRIIVVSEFLSSISSLGVDEGHRVMLNLTHSLMSGRFPVI